MTTKKTCVKAILGLLAVVVLVMIPTYMFLANDTKLPF